MFNIEAVPTFRETVKIVAPGGTEEDFAATFEALEIDEFTGFDLAQPEGTRAFLLRVLLEVDDIVGNDGHRVPHSPELVARLLKKSWVRGPLVAAYLTGLNQAKAGN